MKISIVADSSEGTQSMVASYTESAVLHVRTAIATDMSHHHERNKAQCTDVGGNASGRDALLPYRASDFTTQDHPEIVP